MYHSSQKKYFSFGNIFCVSLLTALILSGFFVFTFIHEARATIIFPYLDMGGIVTDAQTGDPIEGADLHIVHSVWVDKHVFTDSAGEYFSSQECDKNKDVYITITKEGYDTLEYQERFSCYQTVERNFELQPVSSGNANILFLPGLQASRLYRGENTLWEPNRNADVEKLFLDDSGEPINPDIYTEDVVDEIAGVGGNIYKSFLEFLDGLVTDGTINEWKAEVYDWRYNVEDIVNGTIQLENSVISLVEEVESLAASSQNGKVTIISHSNGGLLGKALIQKLEQLGKSGLIETFILVASPQVGTPQAIASILHGQDQRVLGGLIVKASTARELGENMPGGYGLLPSAKYFDIISSPIVEFDPEVSNIYDFETLYGPSIDTSAEFRQFLLGDDSVRSEPDASDTDSPNVLGESFLDQAGSTHTSIDTWEPPVDGSGDPSIKVIQIAGWGLDTVRGIRYDDCDIPFCPQNLDNLDREMILTEDGDGTVVTASATAMDYIGGEGEETYYVDLNGYNTILRVNRKHASILEVDPIHEIISDIIIDGLDNSTLPDHVFLDKPIPKSNYNKLRLKVKSPISIDAIDSSGLHTGLVSHPDPESDLQAAREQIPNSYYFQIGEKKYLGLDTDDEYTITIHGLALGSFTLILEEIFDDEVVSSKSYIDIPVTPDTKGSFTVQTVDSASDLTLDIDGDGEDDTIISPSDEPDPLVSLGLLKASIKTLDIHKGIKKALIRQIKISEKMIKKGFPQVADRILKRMVRQLKRFPNFLIDSDDSNALIGIIEKIRTML